MSVMSRYIVTTPLLEPSLLRYGTAQAMTVRSSPSAFRSGRVACLASITARAFSCRRTSSSIEVEGVVVTRTDCPR
ncbi:hypothetical protein D3C81_1753680 [compost metagenome]